MELLVTGKNLDVTSRDRDYLEKKLTTLQRHFKSLPILVLHIVLAEEKTKASEKRFIVEFTANVRDTLLRAEERGPDLHVAIDRATEVMDRQIERFHGRRQTKRRAAPTGATAAPELVEPETTDGEELPSRIVKVKRHTLKPMSVDEAIDQMELLGHDFFVFLNCDTEELNVVYRRRAGDYGIIESQVA
ncbi:MAG: ribosome-associated translation inhibitor RaiA [Dehalococcoidia bacterium]|nr:ribosome-associated translation inhibitor RaiA [Dehalococcoidia bacterium]